MRCWLLIIAGETGSAHELQAIDAFPGRIESSVAGLEIESVSIDDVAHGELVLSAQESATTALQLLMAEFKPRWTQSLTALDLRFDQMLPAGIQGRSGDLLFALAVFMRIALDMKFVEPRLAGLCFAATGAMDRYGNVGSVDGVAAKLDAVLDCNLPRGAFVLYPQDNEAQIDDLLRARSREAGVELVGVRRLDQALKRMQVGIRGWWDESPYRSLKPYGLQHSPIFFGRRREVAALVALLDARERAGRPGALVVGASGAGKTSLVLCGLLAALSADAGRGRTGRHAVWRPRDAAAAGGDGLLSEADLTRSILACWTRHGGDEQADGAAPRQSGFNGLDVLARLGRIDTLDELAQAAAHSGADPVLRVWVIDQFEELFTLDRFGTALRTALGVFMTRLQGAGIWLIATERAAERERPRGDAPADDALRQVFDGGVFTLGRVGPEALRDIIEEPAAMARAHFEVAHGLRLEDTIFSDALHMPDALPLLEFALDLLFKDAFAARARVERDDDRPLMTHAAYRAFGGLRGAIGTVADETFLDLPADVQAALPTLLYALARPVDDAVETSLPVDLSRWPADSTERRLVTALVDRARVLLVSDGANGGPQLRVAHETLFSHWKTAADILAASRSVRTSLAQWNVRATQWVSSDASTGWLTARDERAVRADQDVLAPGTPVYPALDRLLAASSARRRRHLARGAAAAVVAACLLGVGAWNFVGVTDRRGDARVSQAKAAADRVEAGNRFLGAANAAQSPGQFTDEETRLQNLIAANHLAPGPAAERALGAALFESRQLRRVARMEARAVAATVSPDGRHVVWADERGTLRALGMPSLAPEGGAVTLAGGAPRRLMFAQDGHVLLALTADGRIDSLDAVTLQPRKTPAAPSDAAAFALERDAGRIPGAVSGRFTPDDAAALQRLEHIGPPGALDTVAFSPDGRSVALAVADRRVLLFRLHPFREIARSAALHRDAIFALGFSADGGTLATAGADGQVLAWDARTLAPVEAALVSGIGRVDAFLPLPAPLGGWLVMNQDRTVRLLRATGSTAPGSGFSEPAPAATAVGIDEESDGLAWADAGGTLHLSQGDGGSACVGRGHAAAIGAIAHGPALPGVAGERAARIVATGSDDGTVRLWNSATCRSIGAPLAGPGTFVTAVAFDAAGTHLAAGGYDGTVRQWERHGDAWMPRGAPLRAHRSAIFALAFAPAGDLLATAGGDGGLKIWGASDPTVAPRVIPHTGPVTGVAFAAQGKMLVTGAGDGGLRRFDSATGQPIGEAIREADATEIRSLAVDASGRYLIAGAGSGRVMLWNLAGATPVGTVMRESGRPAVTVAIGRDAGRLAFGAEDALRFSPGPPMWITEACGRLARKMDASRWTALGVGDPCH